MGGPLGGGPPLVLSSRQHTVCRRPACPGPWRQVSVGNGAHWAPWRIRNQSGAPRWVGPAWLSGSATTVGSDSCQGLGVAGNQQATSCTAA